MEINQTLVDSHLPAIESVGTLTARRLSHAEAEELGGETHGTLDLKALAGSLVLEVRAHLLEGLNLSQNDQNRRVNN